MYMALQSWMAGVGLMILKKHSVSFYPAYNQGTQLLGEGIP